MTDVEIQGNDGARAYSSKADLFAQPYKIDVDPRFAIERGRGGDGYDVMEAVGTPPAWAAIPSWGRDGWDLGSWPYVVIYARRNRDHYELTQYVEGDIDAYSYCTKEELYAAIDHIAFFFWRHYERQWVEGIESCDHMPEHLCGPFSRSRMNTGTQAS